VTPRRVAAAASLGFVAGLVAGAALWGTQIHRSRRHLFHRHPARRLAAQGYLAGRPGLDTVRLLTDYVRWESHPYLRRRGEQMLRAMRLALD
jgi:hypothetical protein